jgi:hypothetical protein
MACQDCNNPTNLPSYIQLPGCPQNFIGCDNNCANGVYDTACIIYTGPNLTCIEAETNTCLETIITQIDAKVCTAVGDYSGYNLGCLRDSYTINTAQDFAEVSANYMCLLRTDFDTFVDTTFPAAIDDIEDDIEAIRIPGTTSSCANIVIPGGSTINTVLQILANAGCSLYTAIDPSAANWSQCFTVLTPPTNIVAAFNVVLEQICQVASSTGAVLPIFNNVGTCLPSPGATDSLNNTVIKIRTRLCQTPVFLASNLASSTCVDFGPTSTLEEVIEAQNALLDDLGTNSIRAASSDFIIDDIDSLNPCLGKTISLNTSVIDRQVALNNADLTPGTLLDKVIAGDNISLDFGILNAGKLTITSSAGASNDELVKINAGDPTPGYLLNKLTGSTTSLTFTTVTPLSATQAQVTTTLNISALISVILDTISDDETLKSIFCSLVSSCPAPCGVPTNVQAIQV